MNRDELEEQLGPLIRGCPTRRRENCPFQHSCCCEDDIAKAMRLVDAYVTAQESLAYELWTAEEVARYVGQKGGAPAARSWLSRNGIERVATRPHPESGRPQSLYPANHVRAACIKKDIP